MDERDLALAEANQEAMPHIAGFEGNDEFTRKHNLRQGGGYNFYGDVEKRMGAAKSAERMADEIMTQKSPRQQVEEKIAKQKRR